MIVYYRKAYSAIIFGLRLVAFTIGKPAVCTCTRISGNIKISNRRIDVQIDIVSLRMRIFPSDQKHSKSMPMLIHL